MTTFDSIPVPAELADEVARRRATGADTHDEVWDGTYEMAPAPRWVDASVQSKLDRVLGPLAERVGLIATTEFNLGTPRDFRVPDLGVHRAPGERWLPTAAIVVEVLSPRDAAWAKLPFYAEHLVDEVVIVDPDERTVVWLARVGDTYEPVERSVVLEVDVAEVVDGIEWP